MPLKGLNVDINILIGEKHKNSKRTLGADGYSASIDQSDTNLQSHRIPNVARYASDNAKEALISSYKAKREKRELL